MPIAGRWLGPSSKTHLGRLCHILADSVHLHDLCAYSTGCRLPSGPLPCAVPAGLGAPRASLQTQTPPHTTHKRPAAHAAAAVSKFEGVLLYCLIRTASFLQWWTKPTVNCESECLVPRGAVVREARRAKLTPTLSLPKRAPFAVLCTALFACSGINLILNRTGLQGAPHMRTPQAAPAAGGPPR